MRIYLVGDGDSEAALLNGFIEHDATLGLRNLWSDGTCIARDKASTLPRSLRQLELAYHAWHFSPFDWFSS